FPQEIFPKELLAEIQWYLYEQICQYIKDPQKQDEYCLLPKIPKPKKL
ncbi:11474_t:CDS:1, partial [Dentiscutata heterogama]